MVSVPEFVLDASLAIPWIFRNEANEKSDAAWASLVEGKVLAHVPALWSLEMINVTMRGPRGENKPTGTEEAKLLFDILGRMPIRTHHQSFELLTERTPPLIAKYRLTAYDSAYLVLAMALGLPIASGDERMQKAAVAEGIELA